MTAIKFIITWLVVFVATYAALSALQLVPVSVDEFNYRVLQSVREIVTSAPTEDVQESAQLEVSADEPPAQSVREAILPSRIMIPKINVDFSVVNPMTRDIAALDAALRDGVVRYPGSGGLDDTTNMFLFGHSTTFATVKNEAYKALNNLEKLALNDEIVLRSGDIAYRYRVVSVRNVDKDDALVSFDSVGEKKITLSTCDTFGGNAKEGRIVVEAMFAGSSSL